MAGGTDGRTGLPAASAQLYDPVSETWTATGALAEARAGHSATLLRDGRVLVAGGAIDPDGEMVLDSAELYDPVTGTWSGTGTMSVPRFAPAVVLPDGRVLVAGGITTFVNPMDSRALSSVEIYDPAVGSWTVVAPLHEARFAHTATTLPDGRVLVAFGSPGFGNAFQTAEVFDPVLGTWTPVPGAIEPHYGHTATLLNDGTVLIVGGYKDDDVLASAEVYDPADGTWRATVPTIWPREGHEATLLADGRVLIAGGRAGLDDPLASEIYDPGRGS